MLTLIEFGVWYLLGELIFLFSKSSRVDKENKKGCGRYDISAIMGGNREPPRLASAMQ